MDRVLSSLPVLTVTVNSADVTVLPFGMWLCVSNFSRARRLYSGSVDARVASSVDWFELAWLPPRMVAYTTSEGWLNDTVVCADAERAELASAETLSASTANTRAVVSVAHHRSMSPPAERFRFWTAVCCRRRGKVVANVGNCCICWIK